MWKSQIHAEQWTITRPHSRWSIFSTRAYLCLPLFVPSSVLTSLPVLLKSPNVMMLPPLCFRGGIIHVMNSAWCLPDIVLGVLSKQFNFVSSHQRIVFLMFSESLKCYLANSTLSSAFYSRCFCLRIPHILRWWFAADSPMIAETSWTSDFGKLTVR